MRELHTALFRLSALVHQAVTSRVPNEVVGTLAAHTNGVAQVPKGDAWLLVHDVDDLV